MQIKKTAFIAAVLVAATAPQAPIAWAVTPQKAPPQVNIQNFPEDILQDSVTIYATPRGQQLFSKGVSLLGQNGVQINTGYIPEWDYVAAEPYNLDKLPAFNMAGQQDTFQYLQTSLKKFLPNVAFNDPKINLTVKGISYQVQIKSLSLAPDLQETQFLHADNTVVVNAEIEATQLKIGVNSIAAIDTANKFFSPGDFGVNGMSINAADKTPITFTIPIAVALDAQGRITIKALRIDDNISAIDETLNYTKLILPSIHFTMTDEKDKNAKKDAISSSVNLAPFDADVRSKLGDLATATATYLNSYVQENGLGIINNAIATQIDVNSVFQEVNTMPPAGAPAGTNPVPYMWGMAPHTFSLTDQFMSVQINTFIEDPLSAQHIALPTADRAKGAPNLNAVDPSTYDIALQLDEGFVNRLLQLSFLRGYFNSIPHAGGDPLKLVVAPTITADGTTSPDHMKMHIVLDYTNLPQGMLAKIVDNMVIRNPLQITFDMDVVLQTDTEKGTVTLAEGPIDVDSATVDPSGIKIKMMAGKVLDSVHSSLNQFNADLQTTPSTLTSPIAIPTSIGGTSLVLKAVQADPTGNLMVYAEYGESK